MGTINLTDTPDSGSKPRTIVMLLGAAGLTLVMVGSLIQATGTSDLRGLAAPDPLANAAEVADDLPPSEEAAQYAIGRDDDFVGR